MRKSIIYPLVILASLFGWSAGVNAVEIDKDLLEAYAKPSQYIDVQISPSGKYLASTSRNDDGVVSLIVIDLKKNKPISVTQGRGKDSVSSFSWLNDERLLLTMATEIGAFEQPFGTGELIAMNADGSKKVILTGWNAKSGDRRFSSIIDPLPNVPDQVLIYSVDLTANEPFMDLYRMKISNGRKSSLGRVPLRGYDGFTPSLLTDKNGDVLVAYGQDPRGDKNKTILMARKSVDDEWKVLLERDDYSGDFFPISMMSDGKTMLGLSNLETNTSSIATLNIETKEHEVLLNHPLVDVSPMFLPTVDGTTELIGAAYEYDNVGALFLDGVDDVEGQRFVAQLFNTFKGQNIRVTSITRDRSAMIIAVGSTNSPTVFYSYEKAKGKLAVITPTRPWLKKEMLPKTEIITYKSRDGLTLKALLTLPPNKEAKDLPLVLHPHGGPHGVQDSILGGNIHAKVLANHGYAVLQPNFRGSGGYGLEFLTSGFRKWGLEMIDDMTDGTLELVKRGIVDKERMCVYGASYGGYAAIQSVIREPDLYKCTIGFVGVYDLDMMYELGDIPERVSGLNYLRHVLPQGETEAIQNPIKNVDKIKVPVFIVQGGQDVRVPEEHAFALRDALRERNHPYKWMMKEKEGHGFFNPDNNVELWEEMLKFLDENIGE